MYVLSILPILVYLFYFPQHWRRNLICRCPHPQHPFQLLLSFLLLLQLLLCPKVHFCLLLIYAKIDPNKPTGHILAIQHTYTHTCTRTHTMQIFRISTQVYMSNTTKFTSAGSPNITNITDILYANAIMNVRVRICNMHIHTYTHTYLCAYECSIAMQRQGHHTKSLI